MRNLNSCIVQSKDTKQENSFEGWEKGTKKARLIHPDIVQEVNQQ